MNERLARLHLDQEIAAAGDGSVGEDRRVVAVRRHARVDRRGAVNHRHGANGANNTHANGAGPWCANDQIVNAIAVEVEARCERQRAELVLLRRACQHDIWLSE